MSESEPKEKLNLPMTEEDRESVERSLSLAERKAFRVNAHGDNPAECEEIERMIDDGEL